MLLDGKGTEPATNVKCGNMLHWATAQTSKILNSHDSASCFFETTTWAICKAHMRPGLALYQL